MHIDDLRCFLVVAEELNFTKASRKLFVSQQNVSKQIQRLEQYYGVVLFNRTTPMSLTAAGLVVQRCAREILMVHHRTLKEVGDIKGRITNQIILGVGPARGKSIIPAILPPYRLRYPNVKIAVYEASSKDLEKALLEGKIDFSVSYLPENSNNIRSIKLYTTSFFVVISSKLIDHISDKRSNFLREFSRCFRADLLKELPIITMPKNFKIGSFIDQVFKGLGSFPQVFLESSNVDAILDLCAQGVAFSIIPGEMIRNNALCSKSDLHFIPVIHPGSTYPISLNYLKERQLPLFMKDFISIAQKELLNKQELQI